MVIPPDPASALAGLMPAIDGVGIWMMVKTDGREWPVPAESATWTVARPGTRKATAGRVAESTVVET
jgi:hypothetical protein